jgi:hypothetical protein
MRAGFTLLLSTAFFAAGGDVALSATDPAASASDPALSVTGPAAQSTGTTGAQSSSACPTPKLKGLPRNPKFTNATIHFTLTNMTIGSGYLIKAGPGEVLAGSAATPTVKNSFQLPDQGTKSRKIVIAAIIDSDACQNSPWKLEHQIKYKAVTSAAPATPATPAPTPGAPAAGIPVPARPAPVAPPIKLPKLPKPITERLPQGGPPPSRRAWLSPLDGGARLDQKLSEPALSRLERKVEKANSSNALLGLGIVGGLFGIATLGGFLAFRHRDDVSFERAQLEQLKHLEEGDPGVGFSEDPDAPLPPAEAAPFAADAAGAGSAVTEPMPAAVDTNAPAPQPAVSEADHQRHRAEVEAELQRILNEAGLEAGLEGILSDARAEAERSGIALDPDTMVLALCEEINGSAKLSDTRRTELRDMFAGIIAEEAQQAPGHAEQIPT